MATPSAARSRAEAGTALALERFLPYRLSVLTNLVSGNLARVYAARFDLGIPEWRVLAILGRHPGSTANEIAERAAMDKVAVSRAVGRLIGAGRIARAASDADRRRAHLRLTAQGRGIYERIVPLALAYETDLLSALTPAEARTLDQLIERLHAKATAMDGKSRT